MGKRVTQHDVARRAGVSRATVSYVINDYKRGRVAVAAETRQRVLAAIEELGYQPHAGARSLRSGLCGAIGLLIPDANNPHYWGIVRGVEALAREHARQLVLAISGLEPEREWQALQALAQQRIDGLILPLTYPQRLANELEALHQQGSAIVTFGGMIPGRDTIITPYELGCEQMMDHLLGLDHRRIAFIHGVAAPMLGSDRLAVYRGKLAATGVPVAEEWIIHCGSTFEDGLEAAGRLLDLRPRPTAILGVNDIMALGALRAAARQGLRVPHDLSVAGFDDIPMTTYVTPTLTTVRINGEEMGRRAAELLLHRLCEPECPPQQAYVLPCLVIRESTGPSPEA